MKRSFWIVISGLMLLVTGCKDDSLSAGAGALDSNEEIKVCATSMGGIRSETDSLAGFKVTQTPDSFLLGECNDVQWATIKADLLAQFACPLGSQFPDSVGFDSIALVMTCTSWFGDGNGSLRISAYEIDGEPLYYDSTYSCDIDVSRYCKARKSAVKEDYIAVPKSPTDSVYSSYTGAYIPYIKMRVSDELVKRLEKACKGGFPMTQEEFNQHIFKGLYITTTQGTASALYVGDITMIIYYHYYFKKKATDTEYTIAHDAKYLYANSEVRQVNRFSIPNKQSMIDKSKQRGTNFVVSPAYAYTVIDLPIGQYVKAIEDSLPGLRSYVNKALMNVHVVTQNNEEQSRWDRKAGSASDMLLICKDSLQSFFSNNHLPSSDYCLMSSLLYYIDDSYVYHYYYTFDLATMLQNELRKEAGKRKETIQMVLVPVFFEYASSSTTVVVSKVKINQTITFTELKKDMQVETVFSGFSVRGVE